MLQRAQGWMVGLSALIILLVLPLILPAPQLSLPTEVFIFALFALTYDVVFGFTGLVSFGHSLFIGFGAYALAIALTSHHTSLALAFVVVVLAGAVVSVLSGLLALRTRGVYFAMVTLAFAQAAFTLADTNFQNLTGGDNGMQVSGSPTWLTGPGNEAHFYYVALLVLAAGYGLLRLFVSSPAGRVWQAIRENEQRALMIGYQPYAYKLLSYAVAGTVASLGGGLYALFVGSVSPNLFSADLTIQLLLMVIIGGAGSLWGAMVGAAIMRYLNTYLSDLSTSSLVAHLPHALRVTVGQPLLIFGLIYLALVLFFPQGIAGLVQRRFRLRSAVPQPGLGEVEGRAALPPTGEPAPPEPIESPGG